MKNVGKGIWGKGMKALLVRNSFALNSLANVLVFVHALPPRGSSLPLSFKTLTL